MPDALKKEVDKDGIEGVGEGCAVCWVDWVDWVDCWVDWVVWGSWALLGLGLGFRFWISCSRLFLANDLRYLGEGKRCDGVFEMGIESSD